MDNKPYKHFYKYMKNYKDLFTYSCSQNCKKIENYRFQNDEKIFMIWIVSYNNIGKEITLNLILKS